MDQIKIGKFIAEHRKKANLTQKQLAEKLNITDRAVSKWENGRAMPDSSLMLALCEVLNIDVKDLLCGEIVDSENYKQTLEQNLLEMIRQKEESDKQLLAVEWVIGILSVIVLFVPIILAAYLPIEEWKRILLAFAGFIPGCFGFYFAMKIERVAGYYECGICGHRYIPTSKAMYMAPHMGRTRRMTCPQCGQKSWQKKVLSKE